MEPSRRTRERPATDSHTAREPPNQTAATAKAKVVAAIPCATEAQLASVIGAAAGRPQTRTTRTAMTGAWASRTMVQGSMTLGATAGFEIGFGNGSRWVFPGGG